MTIMNRRTFRIKTGELQNAIEMLRAAAPKTDFLGPVRVYHSLTGEFNEIIIEYEFPDLAGYETFWSNWAASAFAAEFMPQWNTLNTLGGTNEIFSKEIEV